MLGKLNAELVKTLIDNTPVAYIVLDEDYRIQYINEKFLNENGIKVEYCWNIVYEFRGQSHYASVILVITMGLKLF